MLLVKSLFILCLVACALASWDAAGRNMQAELKKRFNSLGVTYCQSFPELSPIPPDYGPLVELINQFASNVSKIISADGVSSLTVNLVYDQDVLWTQGYGLKNLSNPAQGAPDGDTMYRIGSNTKLFTTLLALIAQDSGMLSFNDEVASYVPEFTPINPFPSQRRISFAQLASHMAGMQRECPCDAIDSNCNVTNAVMFSRLQNVTLVNPPGLVPQYSNAGFSVLGHVIEEIVGQEWSDMVEQEILIPLGLNNTGTNVDANFLAGRAIGYTTNNAIADLLEIGWENPAGSMYSSTNDLGKFLSFFFRDDVPYMAQPDQILDSLSIREWRQPRYINIDSTGYGIPWEIYDSPLFYTKGGGIAGYLSLTLSVPQLKLGMIVLQSSDISTAYGDIFSLWATSFIQPFAEILQAVAPAPFIPPNFNDLVGVYLFATSNVTIALIKTTSYPVPILEAPSLGIVLTMKYFSENIFKLSTQGVAMDCPQAEAGWEEYIIFTPSNPPTFSIPGLYPIQIGVKIA